MTDNSDRLSLLPDSMLIIIISLLPFKEAGRTSILSKRWLHIWEQTTNIEFNQLFFVKLNQPHPTRAFRRRVFLDFITNWLDNHKEGDVDKFSLKLINPQKNAFEIVKRCVSYATQKGVKELVLDFSDPIWEEVYYLKKHEALIELPSHVYQHEALKSLKLYSCSFVEANLIKLHALKEVSLGWMELTEEAITILLSNCKMIESLSLISCWNSTRFEMNGVVSRLRKLIVQRCYFQSGFFKVNAPNLCFFKYSGVMNFFDIQSSSLLEEADLDFHLEYENIGLGIFLRNLVKDLYLVRVLTVCSYVLQVLPTGRKPLRLKRDMKTRHLIVKTNLEENELLGITFLLDSCPLLECLTFELGFGRDLNDGDENIIYVAENQKMWMETTISQFQCLNSTLQVVEMNNFVGSVNGFVVLNYLIRFGKVLKMVNINVLKGEVDLADGNKNVALYRQIENFIMTIPRASSDLQISFNYIY